MVQKISNLFFSCLALQLNRVICIVSLVLLTALYIYFATIKDFVIFPLTNSSHIITYTDEAIGGNSEIVDFAVHDSVLLFDFILKDKSYAHYAGMTFYFDDWNVIDGAKYNRINIQMESKGVNNIGIFFFTSNTFNTYTPEICYYNNFNIQEHTKTYTLNFNDFKIPNWWYDVAKISPNQTIPLDAAELKYINVSNAFTTVTDSLNSFRIYSITLSRDNTLVLSILCGIQLFICFVLLVIHFFKQKKLKYSPIRIEYKSTEHIQIHDRTQDFLTYIHTHYSNCNLSIEDVALQTGISKRKISEYLHKTYNCNFKSYVNSIRIVEAKRLLTTSSLHIGEIADTVGYTSQSYFNYVFKNIVGVSPLIYRESNVG